MWNKIRNANYFKDILAQPDALTDTLVGFEPDSMIEISRIILSGQFDQIILTGMGASFHILYPLFYRLMALRKPALMIETSELIHYAPEAIRPGTLLFAVSQSGQSVEVLRLLEMAKDRAPVLAITNNPDGALSTAAQAVVLTRAGEESTVSCKTYVSAMLGLMGITGLLQNMSYSTVMDELSLAPESVGDYLNSCRDKVNALEEIFYGITSLTFSGRGPSLAAAGTAALICKEAAHFPAEGMSSAAFRHGPIEAVSPDNMLVLFEGDEFISRLHNALIADVRRSGGRAEMIGKLAEQKVLQLPQSPKLLSPVLEILPAQLMTVALAKLNDHIPGEFSVATKITEVE
jgi:glucosamine--fructose-6-phosphate aminotransferase (isomerizing)